MAESFKIAEIANAETVATPEPAPKGESHLHQISEPVSSELSRELDARDHNRATLLSPGKVIDNRYKIEQRIALKPIHITAQNHALKRSNIRHQF